MRERDLPFPVFQVGRELSNLSLEQKARGLMLELDTSRVPPAREPLQKLQTGEPYRFAAVGRLALCLCEPLDELPIRRGEEFLFVGRSRRELDELGDRPEPLTSARAEQIQPHYETAKSGVIGCRLNFADCADGVAR